MSLYNVSQVESTNFQAHSSHHPHQTTYVGGLTILKSSTGEVGTLLTIIFFPSVDPIPTDAHDLTDAASENGLVDMCLPVSLP